MCCLLNMFMLLLSPSMAFVVQHIMTKILFANNATVYDAFDAFWFSTSSTIMMKGRKKIHSSEEQMSHQKNKMFKHKIKFLMSIADGSTSQSFIFNWTISFHCSRLIEKTVHRTRKQLRQNVKLFSSSLFLQKLFFLTIQILIS